VKAIFVLLLLAGLPIAAMAETTFLTLGTSSIGGSYYLYGGGISSYFQQNLPDIRITAQTTRGSYENMRLVGNRLNMALGNSQALYERVNGIGSFKADGPAKNLRALMVVDTAPYHWITMEGEGITKIEDLVGKTISIGEPGSGSEGHALMILKQYGIIDKVKLQRLGYSASTTALRDGQIDAYIGASALPMPTIVDLSSTRAVRLLSESEEVIAKVLSEVPSYKRFVIPPSTYKGVDYPVTTLASSSTIVADSSVPDEVVYEFVKSLFTNGARVYMKNVYNAWDPEASVDLFKRIGIALHPGAEKYFREAGLIK
jgi:TRAP transporter TAXI family solute receptor